MPLKRGELYSSASQANRYATGGTQRISNELFQKVQQVNRLLEEIRNLAKEIEESGNAPSREAAREIISQIESY